MKGIMLQGTSSDVGKSLIATLFCRILSDEGIRVAPFKSQNMSNNSYVTKDGLEIGRAQGIQAEAARVEPDVRMNPILLKPQNDRAAEVVLLGKRHASFSGMDYREQFYETGKKAIQEALALLNREFEMVVIEGAGSPVEMNLQSRELVNMAVAEMADVPVLLIADIDRGGVFASIAGTLALLPDEHRRRVKGIIINKFRGDRALFDDGVQWIEDFTGLPVVGVLPYIEHHGIEQEDSLGVRAVQSPGKGTLSAAIIDLPFISNFTDIEKLAADPEVMIEWVKRQEDLKHTPDLILLPGTKSTIQALRTLKELGWQEALMRFHQKGVWLMGICGGFQMMGEMLHDPEGIDSGEATAEHGFGLFDIETVFGQEKRVLQRRGTFIGSGEKVAGYEIHLGETLPQESSRFQPLIEFDTGELDGLLSEEDRLIGTYLHDIFRETTARTYVLDLIRGKKLEKPLKEEVDPYDELADRLKPHLDWPLIRKLMEASDG
ncbi:cobyric acid synthase [Jeotgalibacillus aurantiacus]|uniref:cobyric acid synthase n=1 Tax=Jeotgalibacillus aurantiacus TaxID=2763266 RepID=UPI001D0B6C35|nr:cobyric acid synthase [Jeotgalibacillus aurantiacus]